MSWFDDYTKFAVYRYRYVISSIILIAIGLIVLFVRLNTLLPGLAPAEADTVLQTQSFQDIINNPIDAPFKALQHLSVNYFGGTAFAVRIVSAVFGALSIGLLFSLFVNWHRPRIAVLGMAALVGSSWFLNVARLGTTSIMLPVMILVLITMLTFFHHHNLRWYGAIALVVGFSVILYTPYTIYFILLAILLYYQEGFTKLKQVGILTKIFAPVFIAALVAPLVYGFVNDPSLLRIWLGIPDSLPTITQYFDNFASAFSYIFWRSESNATLHLGNLPMLDIFTATMTALGLYHYERHIDRLKTRFILSGLLLAFIVTSLSGSQFAYSLFLPFVYIIAATGVVTLINQWNNIFPRNPIARTAAIIPIALVLLVTGWYHATRYFIAWPRTPETRRVFAVEPSLVRTDISKEFASDKNILVLATNDSIDQTKVSLLGLEANRKLEVVNVSETAANVAGYDIVYIPPNLLTSELKTVLSDAPLRDIASPRQTQPIAYQVFEVRKQ